MGAKKQINDFADVKQALANSNWAVGPVAGTKIDTTGFSRARFVFSVGPNGGTTAALSGNGGIWKASTSGATYSSISSAVLAAVTSGVLGSNVMVVDVATDSANPWLLISALSVLSTAINMSCVVELYSGIKNAPTSSAQQVVTVG